MPRLRLFLLLLLSVALASCQPDLASESTDAVFRTGDDPRWASPRYSDAGWRAERGQTGSQVFWMRSWVTFAGRDTTVPLGLEVHAFGGFALYWDGVLLGHNGRPASATRAEVPGTEMSCFLVPDSLARPGRHLVAMRATQTHLGQEQRYVHVKPRSYPRLLRDPLLLMAGMNLMAGALLTAAIYYLLLFVSSRRRDAGTLVFSGICGLSFALLAVEYAKFYLDIPYPRFYVRLEIISLLTFAVAGLVPLYFTLQFGLPRRGLLVGGLLAGLAGIYALNYGHYDLTALYLSRAMWAASVLVVLWAVRRRAAGSRLVLAGLLLSAVVSVFLWYDSSLFISFTIIMLCMLYLHTLRIRAMEEEHQAAQLLSARLKLELLKKHIQPHFIKNTLTSLLDWVEESPAQGVVFIQALAREFDLLNDMADARLIPLGQELELCRHHLRVMEFRKEIRYELHAPDLDPAELVPPAIFHTVLENGITHSLPPADGRIRFLLRREQTARARRYVLLTEARNRPANPAPDGSEGTGLQYIRARLQESFGTGWELHSAAVPEGWRTTITITEAE